MPAITVTYWPVELAGPAEAGDWALLSPAERARARRFVREIHAGRFIIARAALRRVLARETGLAPQAVPLIEAEGGRPEIEGEPFSFNVSHSAGKAIIALCRETRIGIDLERHAPIERDLVERFFSKAERAMLAQMTGDAWITGFYRCWTRKEAFVKALGQGLFLPLDEFDVSLDETPRLLRCDFAPVADWSFASLPAGTGYEAVAAVKSRGRPVTLRRGAP